MDRVLPYYSDGLSGKHKASAQALAAVLRVLGPPPETPLGIPPVLVAWEGRLSSVPLRWKASDRPNRFSMTLALERGKTQRWSGRANRHLPGFSTIPWGYHRLTVEMRNQVYQGWVFSAPRRAFQADKRKVWGLFAPTYALHSNRSWGCGDYSTLQTFVQWAGKRKADLIGSLPLLTTFLKRPFDPSPYRPVSRLFWNECFVDIESIPEFQADQTLQREVRDLKFQKRLDRLRQMTLVDYRTCMALKRQVLEKLAKRFFADGSLARRASYRRFIERHPLLLDHAQFRAAQEKGGRSSLRYHLYAQWIASEQMAGLTDQARENRVGLYLDFPLGVHPQGYDAWRYSENFAQGVWAGAPPDRLFPNGQNWGFPPLHPEKIRKDGYRYFIEAIRFHAKHAQWLRLDHVMNFHRLFWIPAGFPAKEGVYVRYHPEEFYAVLSIESHRHRTVLIGEDLGTVPPQVRPAMARHGVNRTYLFQSAVLAHSTRAVAAPPRQALAAIDTHDTPTWACFWNRLPASRKKRLVRFQDLKAVLRYLAKSPAQLFLINLEDLWGETESQNVPGTQRKVNWRRKNRYPLESMTQMPRLRELLENVSRARRER